ncbi:MAG: CotH kinase family protein [Alphaproteobacteria bacterium]|nr:CotH kinase family protein [Alphaproteobacteria bacterium]
MLVLIALSACKPATTGDPCGDVFDGDSVETLAVELSEETLAALQDEFVGWEARRDAGLEAKPYHPVERLDYRCQTVFDAQVRLKGNPCCSWDGEKMQLTFAFNQTRSSGRFQGLRKIALDAPYYDPSLLRERVAYAAFEQMGQPASHVNHVRLDINGEYYGLFANIEVLDKEWLQDRLPREDAEGTLWKLDYLAGRMEPRTNEDHADRARWLAFTQADDLDTLDAYMDLETSMEGWAAEVLVNQSDGYWVGGVNWMMYDHPRLGFQLLPWDLDNTFDRWPPNVAPTSRSGTFGPTRGMDLVLADPGLRQVYIDTVARRHARVDPGELVALARDWDDQIREHLEEDPHRPYPMEEHDEHVDALVRAIRERHAFLAEWLEDEASPGLRAERPTP